MLRNEKVGNERNSRHLAGTASAASDHFANHEECRVEDLTFAGVGGDGNVLGSTRPVRWRRANAFAVSPRDGEHGAGFGQ
jgi:hypothetical protein